VRVALTQTGQEIYHTSNAVMCRQIERWLLPFTVEEQRLLTGLMRRLVAAMEDTL
jgi:hypothetical protein